MGAHIQRSLTDFRTTTPYGLGIDVWHYVDVLYHILIALNYIHECEI